MAVESAQVVDAAKGKTNPPFRTILDLFAKEKDGRLGGWPKNVNRMMILVTIIHIIVCLFLIIVVLLQSGQSGDIAAAFGGMGSQTAFGPRGAATTLSRATTTSAIIFMVTSITLSVMVSRHAGPKSVLQGLSAPATKTQPAKPAPTAPATPQK